MEGGFSSSSSACPDVKALSESPELLVSSMRMPPKKQLGQTEPEHRCVRSLQAVVAKEKKTANQNNDSKKSADMMTEFGLSTGWIGALRTTSLAVQL